LALTTAQTFECGAWRRATCRLFARAAVSNWTRIGRGMELMTIDAKEGKDGVQTSAAKAHALVA
jgi:hypothetical protein